MFCDSTICSNIVQHEILPFRSPVTSYVTSDSWILFSLNNTKMQMRKISYIILNVPVHGHTSGGMEWLYYIFKVAISSPKTYEDQYMNSLFY